MSAQTPAVSPAALAERYTLRKKLRAHTAGKPQVWLARDRRLGCDVVLKKYASDDLATPWAAERALLSLGLPQLPRLFDAVRLPDGSRILVREYIGGAPSAAIASKAEGSTFAETLRRTLLFGSRAANLAHALHTARPQGISLPAMTRTDDFLICGDSLDSDLRLLPAVSPDALVSGSVDVRRDVARLGALLLGMLGDVEACSVDQQPELLRVATDVLARATHADPDQRHGSALWLAQALEAAAQTIADQGVLCRSSTSSATRTVQTSAHLVAADETLAGCRLRAGQLSHDLDLAKSVHALHELTSDSSAVCGLAALDSLDCDRYPHQLETVRQVVTRSEMAAGAILSDEVGLGKTIEALLICQELRARGHANSVLIVATPSGAPQWLAECRRRMRVEPGGNASEFHLYAGERDIHRPLLIVSSATLRRRGVMRQIVQSRKDDLVIVDEAHQCCLSGGKAGSTLSPLGESIASLRRRRLLLLTATPITSSPNQLATLADLIQPGLIDDSLLCAIQTGENEAALSALRTRMQAVMVRHRRSDLTESLPSPVIGYRRIVTPNATIAAKVEAGADLICGAWRRERVVAFCRSLDARTKLAGELRRRMPGRTVIHFQGGRREQKAQESAFGEYADAVMIAGDKSAEGMNWQRARCLAHLDVPLTPIVWEQRLGRIVRLGQKAKDLEVVHFAAPGSGEARALDLYEHALGLFSLSVGDAANALDYAEGITVGSLARGVWSLLSPSGLSETRYDLIAQQLRRARSEFDRKKLENDWLDALYGDQEAGQWQPLLDHEERSAASELSRRVRLEECVHSVIDCLGAKRREARSGSGVWIADFADSERQRLIDRMSSSSEPGGSAANRLLYTFDLNRWEAGSRLQCLTTASPLVKRLRDWGLSSCAAVEAHNPGAQAYEPYLAASFSSRIEGVGLRESSEWFAVNLRSGRLSRMSQSPLEAWPLIPGAPCVSGISAPSSEELTRTLRLLVSHFNAVAAASLAAERNAAQSALQQSQRSISAARRLSLERRYAALQRAEENAALRLETYLTGVVLLWARSK